MLSIIMPLFRIIGRNILLVFVMGFLIFWVFSLIPGDIATITGGTEADEQLLESIRDKQGLSHATPKRFLLWGLSIVQGDLGYSIRYDEAVSSLIQRHAKVTLRLALLAMMATIGMALFTASIAVIFYKKWITSWVVIFNQLFMAIPQFWLGLLVIQLFGIHWGMFGLFHTELLWQDYFFPAIVLALVQSAYLSRYIIYAWQREVKQRYVTSGLARGISHNNLRFKHALRGGLIPSVTIMGLIWIDLLSGSVIIEKIFVLPGLGQLLVNAVGSRDIPLIQGIVLYFIFIVIISNFIVHLLYQWLNPRG
ncbi:ABC transporter permease [Entomospira nematocerorum]|uniref:ABC transporter permease n=1 Tax=Entomospira nematocerorum TaxID=2719987 RepID=A0A968GF26_9SPIO|nr:ABC transporter permease [Entomospira nematocera]NIZ47095.1 ABC transporter permease [Entomospira nematocera]WDI34360.1 ABC transporter permease [Entomospira nematocera]